jgi:hypothetical protein
MSCLFNSIGALTGEDPGALRHHICDYIASNPQLIEGVNSNDVVQWESGMSLESYVSEMRKTSTWGGAIEVKAYVDMTGIPVHVVDIRPSASTNNVIKLMPSGRLRRKKPLVLHWSGGHYSPSRQA